MDAAGKGPHTRVLVVDDEPSIRLLCRINLELDGHEVVEAGSLAEARRHLGEERVDVVLLDVHLGQETSRDLVGECHEHEPPIPVVLVTGSPDALFERDPEADAVLPKPFEPQALLEAVRRLAGDYPNGRMPPAPARKPVTSSTSELGGGETETFAP